MLTIPANKQVYEHADYVWLSDDLQWRFELYDEKLTIYQHEQLIKTIMPAQISCRLKKTQLYDFQFNEATHSCSWIIDDRKTIFVIRNCLTIIECRMYAFEQEQDHHILSPNGRYLISKSMPNYTDGSFKHSYIEQDNIIIIDNTTPQRKVIKNAVAFSLIDMTLFFLRLDDYRRAYQLCRYDLETGEDAIPLILSIPYFSHRMALSSDLSKLALVYTYASYTSEIGIYTVGNGKKVQVLKPQFGITQQLFFAHTDQQIVCRLGLAREPNKNSVNVFYLNDPRQSYYLTYESVATQLVLAVDKPTVTAYADNKVLQWPIVARHTPEKRLAFNLVNKFGRKLQVPGVELLKLSHKVVNKILQPIVKDYQEKDLDDLRHVDEPKKWLALVGRLANCIARSEIMLTPLDSLISDRAWLHVGRAERHYTMVQVKPVGNDAYVNFQPICEGDYVTIQNYIALLTTKAPPDILQQVKIMNRRLRGVAFGRFEQQFINYHHSDIAKILLKRIKLEDYPEHFNSDQRHFFDTLLVLMLGVEASRVNTSYLQTLLLFDLIANNCSYGRLSRAFSFDNLFTSGPGYTWNDDENKNLGGKYPMASNSTHRGNLALRATMLSDGNDGLALKEIINNPQKHQIPRKEIAVLIHWLNNLSEQHKTYLTDAPNKEALVFKIERLLTWRLQDGYALPIKEATLNGVHMLNRGGFSHKQPYLDAQKNYQKCQYYLSIQAEKRAENSFDEPYFHRTDVPCKLLNPHYARGEELETRVRTTTANPILCLRRLFAIEKRMVLNEFAGKFFTYHDSKITINPGKHLMLTVTDQIEFTVAQTRSCILLLQKFLCQYELPVCRPERQESHSRAKRPRLEEQGRVIENLLFIPSAQNPCIASISLDDIKKTMQETLVQQPKNSDTFKREILQTLAFDFIDAEVKRTDLGRLNFLEKSMTFNPAKGLTGYTDLNGHLWQQLKNKSEHFPELMTDESLQSLINSKVVFSGDIVMSATDKLIWLLYHCCDCYSYTYKKVYRVETEDEKVPKQLRPCPKCYSSANTGYFGIPYASDSVPCFVIAEDPHYHRIFLAHDDQTHCNVILFDKVTQWFVYHPNHPCSSKTVEKCSLAHCDIEVQFVAKAKQDKRACPLCWS